MAQKNLHTAKKQKNDEFYTQMNDIANELKHYREQLKDKVIFCNCDDPFESNFFKYFAANFNTLGIKKLIATSYMRSPIVGGQLSLLDIEGLKPESEDPYMVEINEIPDLNDDGAIGLDDVEHLLKNDKNVSRRLKGDAKFGAGDFRSEECIELLKQADIVVTNPPFSLFREYIAQLFEYEKKFLIIGSKNAITYKDVFKLIKENKLWLGYGFSGGNAFFKIPPEKAREFSSGVYDPDTGLVKFRNVAWFTNLFVDKSDNPIISFLTFEQGMKKGLYPKYDNYDAIEVSKIAEIPSDYYGAMGVPITFLDRWTPDVDMEIIKFRKGDDDKDLTFKRERESSAVLQNPHQENSKSSGKQESLNQMEYAVNTKRGDHILTDKESMQDYSSSEFEILWTTDRGGDGMLEAIKLPHKRYDAPVVNGKGLYKRIMIKRKANP